MKAGRGVTRTPDEPHRSLVETYAEYYNETAGQRIGKDKR
jgi:hypothetical protein